MPSQLTIYQYTSIHIQSFSIFQVIIRGFNPKPLIDTRFQSSRATRKHVWEKPKIHFTSSEKFTLLNNQDTPERFFMIAFQVHGSYVVRFQNKSIK